MTRSITNAPNLRVGDSPHPLEGVAKVTSASYLVNIITLFAFIRVHLRTKYLQKKLEFGFYNSLPCGRGGGGEGGINNIIQADVKAKKIILLWLYKLDVTLRVHPLPNPSPIKGEGL
jgi:hypothetical protein